MDELNPTPSSPIKAKKDLHLMRKIWHCLPGLALVTNIYNQWLPHYLLVILLGLGFLAVSFGELLRLNYKQFNRLTIHFSKHIMRREELKNISGVPYYLGSCFLVLLIFNTHIATLSILYLALGDPFASFMGIKYGEGSHKFANGKSIIGTLGGITICMIATMVYGTLVGWEVGTIFPMAFFGGLAGGLSETFVIEDINDNLFIPLVSAAALSIVYANMI